jgi:hypothetical protein
MSNKLTRAVRDNRTIKNPHAKAILAILADHANSDTGRCNPSIPLLVDESAYSHGTVAKCLKWLKDQGLIDYKSGKGSLHYYTFPGLQSSPPHGLVDDPSSSPRHGLLLDTHASKNGAVESAQVVHRTDYSSPQHGLPLVHRADYSSPQHGLEAEGSRRGTPKNPSAATTTAKEPPASAVAAGEPFAPTDQSSHGITEKWIESLKSEYPQVNGDYVVDDLVTRADQKRTGCSGQLIEWLCEHARDQGCSFLILDSGVQRFEAHRFYLAHRMDITAHHFARKL